MYLKNSPLRHHCDYSSQQKQQLLKQKNQNNIFQIDLVNAVVIVVDVVVTRCVSKELFFNTSIFFVVVSFLYPFGSSSFFGVTKQLVSIFKQRVL